MLVRLKKIKKRYYTNNIIGTQKLLEACKNSNVKNIIFSSSCSIYGNVNGSVNESRKPNPQGYYGYTKFKGEELIKKLSLKYLWDGGLLRLTAHLKYLNVKKPLPTISGHIYV